MIHIEHVYFAENELIRAASLDGDYEDFMIMSIENPERYNDFITVETFYVGDTDHHDEKILTEKDFSEGAITHTPSLEFEHNLIETAEKELGVDGYIYVCHRDDDEYGIGICSSKEPLKKATEEEWQKL